MHPPLRIGRSDAARGSYFEESCSRVFERRFQAVLCLVVAGLFVLSHEQWGWWIVSALFLALPALLAFLAFLVWFSMARRARFHRDTGGGSEMADAGKPAPIRPGPSHHLAAAKGLPPSDETHSLPHD